jgi:hypothetical protein
MEFEKTLFRVHEKILSSDGMRRGVEVCFGMCAVLSILTFSVFIYSNSTYMNQNPCLGPLVQNLTQSLAANNTTILADNFFNITILDYGDNPLPYDPSNNGTNIDTVYEMFEFSGNSQVLLLNPEWRSSHNFTSYNITIDAACYASTGIGRYLTSQFIDFENILMNEMIMSFKGMNRTMRNAVTGEIWTWQDDMVNSYLESENPFFFLS